MYTFKWQNWVFCQCTMEQPLFLKHTWEQKNLKLTVSMCYLTVVCLCKSVLCNDESS